MSWFQRTKKALFGEARSTNEHDTVDATQQEHPGDDGAPTDRGIDEMRDGPDKVAAYYNQALAYQKRHQWSAALAYFNKAARLAPGFGLTYLNRGVMLLSRGGPGDYEAAIADCDRAIALLPHGPKQAAAYLNRGTSYDYIGNLREALADYTRAAAIDSEFAGTARREQLRIREKMASGAQAATVLADGSRSSGRNAESCMQEGWSRLQHQDPAGSLAAFNTAVELNPTENAFYGRGVANCTLKRYREALTDLNSALELEPRFPAALTERGLAYVESGDIDRGLGDYTKAIRINPCYAIAYINKGSALCLQARWREAIPLLDIGLRLQPGNIDGRFNRSVAHEMLGDFLRAVVDLEACLKIDTDGFRFPGASDRLVRLNAAIGLRSMSPWSISEEMWTEVAIVEPGQTVSDLVAMIGRKGAFFVVLESAEGNRAVAPVYGHTGLRHRLTEIADVVGESILSLRLEQFHDLWSECAPVESGIDRELALQRLEESGGHTIVLESERILGVFSCGFSHYHQLLPTAIFCSEPAFGRNDQAERQRQCSVCKATLAYFEAVLRDGMLDDYACPECKASPVPYWVEARMRSDRWSRCGFLGDQESLAEIIASDEAALGRLKLSHGQVAAALERLLEAASTAYADRIDEATERFEDHLRSAGKRGVEGEAVLQLRPSLDEVESQLLRRELPDSRRGVLIDKYQVFLKVYLGYQYCPWTILRRPWSNEEPPMPISTRRTDGVVHHTALTGRELPCRLGLNYRYADRDFIIINRNTGQHIRGSGLMVHLIRHHSFFEGVRSPYRLEPEHTARVLDLL